MKRRHCTSERGSKFLAALPFEVLAQGVAADKLAFHAVTCFHIPNCSSSFSYGKIQSNPQTLQDRLFQRKANACNLDLFPAL